MAAYPSIGLTHKIEPINARSTDVSVNGDIRTTDLGEETAYRIQITHWPVDSTDRDTLKAFYDTNKNNVNAITLAGTTYDTHFETDYSIHSDNDSWFRMDVTLYGNEQ
jgi:hypothetical protein